MSDALKFEAVIALEAPERYDHFLEHAAEQLTVWSLWQGGWASVADDEGREGLPVWPAAEYAEDWKRDRFPDWEVMPLDLHWLLDEMLPNIQKEGGYVVVFPTADGSIWPEPAQLEADLREELSLLE